MKLLNATDKKTDKLSQYGMLGQGVAVDGEVLMPGKEREIEEKDVARVEAEHAHLFAIGALAWTKPQEAVRNALVEIPAPPVTEEKPAKTEKPKGQGR